MELLSCPLCLKPHFEGVDELRSSLISAATSQISCPVCEETLMGLDKLTIHLFSHITHNLVQESLNKPPARVEKTSKHKENRSRSESKKNSSANNEIKEPMDVQSYDNLIEESILTIPKDNVVKKTIRCDICNFYFSDENILDMHQKLLHQTQVDANTGQCNYHCHLCSKKFKMRGSLMVHLRVAHYGFANQDSSSLSSGLSANENSKSAERNEKTNEGKQWVCDVCSKQFTTKYFLKKHKRLHTGEMPYFCAQCNKSFTFQQSYHKHMLYHSSEKPHLCSECGRAFKELSTLHNHERIHSGERPFVCETCGKSFRQRVSYLVHRRIHTGVMPYKCTACDKSFRYKVSQKSHKCPANPPGSVVRAPVLVDRLIEKTYNKEERRPQNSDLKQTSPIVFDVPQNYINLYPQQEPRESDNKIQNCIVKLENEAVPLKSNTDANLLIGAAALSVENSVKLDNGLNTIIFNADGQIIGQNFSFPVTVVPKPTTNDCSRIADVKIENSDVTKRILYNKYAVTAPTDPLESSENKNEYENNSNKNPDFLSMVLSPVMPDVQSLCLSSSPTNDKEESPLKQPLETINEESFKSLLDGLPI